MNSIAKPLLIAAGTLSVVLGALGMLLPLLPTTPFLLLAAVCYGKSSDRFYRLLITNPVFGKYIKNYHEGRGIPIRQKIITIAVLWLSIAISLLFLSTPLWTKLLLIGIASGVSIYLVRVKTMEPETYAASSSDGSI